MYAPLIIRCRSLTELLGGETFVSCSVVLPALCPLCRTTEVSEEDPAYVERFKTAFKRDLSQWQANISSRWLKIVSALDPHFKDLRYLPRGESEEVWTSLEALLQEEASRATPEPLEEPPKKKRSLLLLVSDSDDDMRGDIHGCLPWLPNTWPSLPLLSPVRDFFHLQVT